jgi:hypothetical protein
MVAWDDELLFFLCLFFHFCFIQSSEENLRVEQISTYITCSSPLPVSDRPAIEK